jgi:hypothetical protein
MVTPCSLKTACGDEAETALASGRNPEERGSTPCVPTSPYARRQAERHRSTKPVSGGSIPLGRAMGRHVPRPGDGVLQALCGRFDSDSIHKRSEVAKRQPHLTVTQASQDVLVQVQPSEPSASGEIWQPHQFQKLARESACRFKSDLADQNISIISGETSCGNGRRSVTPSRNAHCRFESGFTGHAVSPSGRARAS